MSEPMLDEKAMHGFSAEAKIGLLATVDPEGRAHLSLITSILPKSESELMFGQFCEGRSKKHVLSNPKTAFLVMSIDRDLWRGQAHWKSRTTEGEDFVRFNQLAMFRYNSYLGIHTVHYLDIVAFSGHERLPVPGMVAGYLPLAVGGGLSTKLGRSKNDSFRGAPLNHWTRTLLSRLDTLKFLTYVTDSGYPTIIPAVPAHPFGGDSIHLLHTVHRGELEAIPDGAAVALFGLNLQMENVLVRGAWVSAKRGFEPWSRLDVDWVYNSMPPVPGRIYPPEPLQAVETFE